MQKEINFYQEMASEHRLQEYSKGSVPLFITHRNYEGKYFFCELGEKKPNFI